MDTESIHVVLSGLNLAALMAAVGYGFKIARHLARMEFRLNLMWAHFKKKMGITDESL